MTPHYAAKVSSDIITRSAEWPCADSRRPADSLPVALASPALFRYPALGRFDEGDQLRNVGRTVERRAHLLERLRGIEFRAQQQPVSAFQAANALVRKTAPLETDGIDAETLRGALGDHARKWRHILRDDGGGANIRVAPDATELVHRGKCTHRGEILCDDVAGKRGAIDEQRVAADDAIVTYVRIGQEK